MVAVSSDVAEPKNVFALPRHSYIDPMRPVDHPLAWVGADRILLDDVTVYGLHRWVVASKGDVPNVVSFLQTAMQKAGDAKVAHWLVWKDDGYCYLWMVWKEAE